VPSIPGRQRDKTLQIPLRLRPLSFFVAFVAFANSVVRVSGAVARFINANEESDRGEVNVSVPSGFIEQLDSSDHPGAIHGTSATPASALARRAIANSRSLKRFR